MPARDLIEPDGRINGVGVDVNEFRYDPGTRQIEGRVRNTETDAVACSFSVPAPNAVD